MYMRTCTCVQLSVEAHLRNWDICGGSTSSSPRLESTLSTPSPCYQAVPPQYLVSASDNEGHSSAVFPRPGRGQVAAPASAPAQEAVTAPVLPGMVEGDIACSPAVTERENDRRVQQASRELSKVQALISDLEQEVFLTVDRLARGRVGGVRALLL